MFSQSLLALASLTLLPAALAQLPSIPTGLSVPTAELTAVPTAAALSVAQNLLPEASITSLSPAQASALAADAGAYVSGYTASNPISKLEQEAFVGALIGGSMPSDADVSRIEAFLAGAETAVLANPTGYVASLDALVSPYGFAGAVSTYAGNLVDGLRTVVASDVGVPVPTPTAHANAAPAAMPTGVMGVAAAAAMGVVGFAML